MELKTRPSVKRTRIAFAAMVVLLWAFVASIGFAQDKRPVIVVNRSGRENVVLVYDVYDDWRLVACQRLVIGPGQQGSIAPTTAGPFETLVKDHCGNYEKLHVEVRYQGVLGTKHFWLSGGQLSSVPWGATIELLVDGARCNGC